MSAPEKTRLSRRTAPAASLFLPWLLAALPLPAGTSQAAPASRPPEGPRVLALPSGVRFVLLERPGEFLTFAATFTAAGIASEGNGEEGLSQILAEESLHGTWALGSPGWVKEKRWLSRRDQLLETEARALLQGRQPSPALEKERTALTRTLLEQTRALAWLARLEEEGAAGIASWADPAGFGLRLALPSSHVGRFLSLEAVRFRTPALRRVVESSRTWRERRAQALRRDPWLRGRSLLLGEAFRIHPKRRYLSNVAAGPILWGRAWNFWRREVLPERTVLALVGPLPAGLERLIRDLWGKWTPSKDRPLPLPAPAEPPQEGPRTLHAQTSKDREGVLLGWRIPKEADREGILLLAELLGDPATGWIPAVLGRDRGLFRSARIRAPYPDPRPPFLFVVEIAPREGDTPAQAADTLLQFLPTWSPSQEEFALAKARVLADLAKERNTPARTAARLAEEEAAGAGARAWWSLPGRVKAYTLEKAVNLAKRIFRAENRNLVLLESSGKSGKEEREP